MTIYPRSGFKSVMYCNRCGRTISYPEGMPPSRCPHCGVNPGLSFKQQLMGGTAGLAVFGIGIAATIYLVRFVLPNPLPDYSVFLVVGIPILSVILGCVIGCLVASLTSSAPRKVS